MAIVLRGCTNKSGDPDAIPASNPDNTDSVVLSNVLSVPSLEAFKTIRTGLKNASDTGYSFATGKMASDPKFGPAAYRVDGKLS